MSEWWQGPVAPPPPSGGTGTPGPGPLGNGNFVIEAKPDLSGWTSAELRIKLEAPRAGTWTDTPMRVTRWTADRPDVIHLDPGVWAGAEPYEVFHARLSDRVLGSSNFLAETEDPVKLRFEIEPESAPPGEIVVTAEATIQIVQPEPEITWSSDARAGDRIEFIADGEKELALQLECATWNPTTRSFSHGYQQVEFSQSTDDPALVRLLRPREANQSWAGGADGRDSTVWVSALWSPALGLPAGTESPHLATMTVRAWPWGAVEHLPPTPAEPWGISRSPSGKPPLAEIQIPTTVHAPDLTVNPINRRPVPCDGQRHEIEVRIAVGAGDPLVHSEVLVDLAQPESGLVLDEHRVVTDDLGRALVPVNAPSDPYRPDGTYVDRLQFKLTDDADPVEVEVFLAPRIDLVVNVEKAGLVFEPGSIELETELARTPVEFTAIARSVGADGRPMTFDVADADFEVLTTSGELVNEGRTDMDPDTATVVELPALRRLMDEFPQRRDPARVVASTAPIGVPDDAVTDMNERVQVAFGGPSSTRLLHPMLSTGTQRAVRDHLHTMTAGLATRPESEGNYRQVLESGSSIHTLIRSNNLVARHMRFALGTEWNALLSLGWTVLGTLLSAYGAADEIAGAITSGIKRVGLEVGGVATSLFEIMAPTIRMHLDRIIDLLSVPTAWGAEAAAVIAEGTAILKSLRVSLQSGVNSAADQLLDLTVGLIEFGRVLLATVKQGVAAAFKTVADLVAPSLASLADSLGSVTKESIEAVASRLGDTDGFVSSVNLSFAAVSKQTDIWLNEFLQWLTDVRVDLTQESLKRALIPEFAGFRTAVGPEIDRALGLAGETESDRAEAMHDLRRNAQRVAADVSGNRRNAENLEYTLSWLDTIVLVIEVVIVLGGLVIALFGSVAGAAAIAAASAQIGTFFTYLEVATGSLKGLIQLLFQYLRVLRYEASSRMWAMAVRDSVRVSPA